uniref:hypothetical protein n=1 Tax=Bradyrhizobium sp. (strain ORS 278) TaxID=114615 RepID=UPI0018D29AE3|nr:hypothetical protein [Bradyrhizobium sp. ORS 278]
MTDASSQSTSIRDVAGQAGRQYVLVIVHLFIAVAAFSAAGVYSNYFLGLKPPQITQFAKEPADVVVSIINLIVAVFAAYFPLVAAIWVGLKFAARANALMRAAFYEQTSVVPAKDFDLVKDAIKDGKSAPVTEYIRLVSLTGGVGIFQKIGLTGLPLVTLGLVLFFSCGVLFTDSKSETFNAFLDFTKLTLGAFIGSFVQRQVESRSQEAELRRAVENIKSGGGGTPPVDGTTNPSGPDAGTAEAKATEAKAAEAKAAEAKAAEAKAAEAKAAEAKAAEAKAAESGAGEVKVAEAKIAESRMEEAKANEAINPEEDDTADAASGEGQAEIARHEDTSRK